MHSDPSSRPLRILWIASKLSWEGGIGRVLAGASEALVARGHEVHLAGRAPGGTPAAIPGVHLHPWPKTNLKIRLIPTLLALQRELRADVVHFHAALAHGELIGALRFARRGLGSPRIFVTPHTAARTHYPKLRSRLGVRLADAVLTPSKWSAQHAITAGASAADAYEVYAGIDLPETTDFERRSPLVVALGRAKSVKGFDTLIEAFARAAASRPEWRLTIGGDGPELEPLRARAETSAVADRIELPGQITGQSKLDLLASASIGVVPSHKESFGGVLLEFEAQGLACIATPVGGMAEITNEGHAATRVPPGDVDALSKALEELMDDASLRARRGEQALEFARGLSWAAAAERYEDLYRRYLG